MTNAAPMKTAPRRLPVLFQQVVICLALLASMQISVLLSPVGVQGYIFWPVTGFAVAALTHRPQLFFGVAIGLWLWSGLGPLGWWLGTLGLLTLLGPLLYWQIDRRWHFAESVPKRRLTGLGLVVIFSLVPSALIGTFMMFLLSDMPPGSAFVAFLVYLLSDFAGTVIFLPLVGQWLTRTEHTEWRCVGLVAVVAAVPLLLTNIGLGAFSQVSLFMVVPVLIGIAQTANRATLSHAVTVVFMAHLSMAYFGTGGYEQINTLAEMASLAILLLAVYVTMDTLQGMRVDRDRALHRSEWQAEHDHRSPALNELGLIRWSQNQNLGLQAGALYRPVNKDIYLQTLSWEQLGELETRLLNTLQTLLPEATIARVSDLTLAAVLPSEQLDTHDLRELLETEINVDGTSLTVDGAVASFSRLSTDMTENLAKLNTLWSTAVREPNLRLRSETSVQDAAASQNMIDVFQRYRNAIENGGLELWLQPIRTLSDGRTTKAEVLARLNATGPDGGHSFVNPGQFLPVFQMFNYLTEFDRKVLEQTFSRFEEMRGSLGEAGTLNVNITGATLSDIELVNWFSSGAETHNVSPDRVCIEITETDQVESRKNAIANIHGLRALGFQVAIDDFGTGLASFEYLNNFPVNLLKLDGQFISGIADNQKHQTIVRAMVQIAESYGLELVGEFVDGEAALACLRDLGVHYAQGYHIGRPSNDWQ